LRRRDAGRDDFDGRDGGTQLVRNDADGATVGTSTVSDDGTTFTRGKFA